MALRSREVDLRLRDLPKKFLCSGAAVENPLPARSDERSLGGEGTKVIRRDVQAFERLVRAANVHRIIDANIARRFTVSGSHFKPVAYGFDNCELCSLAELGNDAR